MNVNEEDFQNRLDEIGKIYEDGKNAINGDSMYSNERIKSLECIRKLRDIAVIAVKQAYQLKEN